MNAPTHNHDEFANLPAAQGRRRLRSIGVAAGLVSGFLTALAVRWMLFGSGSLETVAKDMRAQVAALVNPSDRLSRRLMALGPAVL